MTERIVIVPGIAMPFFPPRPALGRGLRTPDQAAAQLSADLDLGYTVQPKLNGDRVGLAVTLEEILVQNRHGGWLAQKVRNAKVYAELGAGTCLDGEVIDGDFYPFEAVAWGGTSLVNVPTVERVRVAKHVCSLIGVPFLFSPPTMAFIRQLRGNLPRWEGYVRKAHTGYVMGGSAGVETTAWLKCKW